MSINSMKPLILHAHGTGPNPYKVAIMLELLRLPYNVKLWDFGDGPGGVKSSEFLAINENGRVPALEDPNTGVTSWESGAVLNYLSRVYDTDNKYFPRGKTEQDKVDYEKWSFFLLSTLGPMMGQVNWFRHYHGKENKDALERYEAQALRCFDVLEEQLKAAGSGFVLKNGTVGSDGFSTVDAHFYPWVNQAGFAQLSLDKYPQIKGWLERCGNMSEVKAAYEKVPKGQKA